MEDKKWQLDVSEKLGTIIGTLDGVNARLDKMNGTQANHEDRLDCLEEAEHEKRGAKKFLSGLWAIIGGLIVWVMNKFVEF